MLLSEPIFLKGGRVHQGTTSLRAVVGGCLASLALTPTTLADDLADLQNQCGTAISIIADPNALEDFRQFWSAFLEKYCSPGALAARAECPKLSQMAGDPSLTPEQRQLASDFYKAKCL